jgi:MFS family permease
MATGTFPGFAFGVLGPELVVDLGLSRTALGLISTVHFVVGGLGSIGAGRLVDRFGARRMMVAAFVSVALALAGMGLAPSYVWLLAGSAASGFALATGNPSTNRAVSERIPAGRRGIIMGVKQAGVQVGAFLAGSLLAPFAQASGWRTALLASAVVPAVGALLALVAVPADGAVTGATPTADRPRLPSAVRHLAVYAFLMGAGVAAVIAYLPLFAVERLALTTATAGAVAAAIGSVGIVSRVAWGAVAERIGSFRLPLTVMGVGAVAATLAIMAAPRVGLWVVWVGAVLMGMSAVTWNTVGMMAVIAEVDVADSGRASGVVLFGYYLGFVPSPLVFGRIVDTTGSYTTGWVVITVVFVVSALWVRRAH